MTTAHYNVRILTGDGIAIDIPCQTEDEARAVRNAALNDGFHRVRIGLTPASSAIAQHSHAEDN